MMQTERRGRVKGAFTIILLIDAGIFILLLAGVIAARATGISGGYSGVVDRLLLPSLVVIALLTAAIIVYYRRFIRAPLESFESALGSLLDEDFKSLVIALSELAGGNLTAHAAVRADTTRVHGWFETRTLAEFYGKAADFIRDGSQDFNAVTAVSCRRLCYVGADSFREGKKCGDIMGELLAGDGEVAILLSSFKVSGNNLRNKGFQSRVAEKYPGIRIVRIMEEQEDAGIAYQKAKEVLSEFHGLTGIYVCEGQTPPHVARAVAEAGRTGKVRIVCHDLTDETMRYLTQGVITATLSQNPYAQGYDPLIHLYNYLATQRKPVIPRLLTEMGVITRENYKDYWSAERGAIVSERERKALAVAEENSTGRKRTLAVILPNDILFWKPVAEGARAAIETLKAFHVEVKLVIPEACRKGDMSAGPMIPVLDELTREGYEAVSLPIFDKDLVSDLNARIDKGMAVATFNAEPASFRGMVDAVSLHAQNLFRFSNDLAAGSNEASQAAAQISKTMKSILSGTKIQQDHLSTTDKTIDSLRGNIRDVTRETTATAQASAETLRTAKTGFDTVQKNHDAIQALKLSSETTTRIINQLNADTNRIREIVGIIEDIASQTNVLSINAAIQAARAGGEGKGFAVVASEIKTLAEQSARAAGDIKKLIQTIQGGVGEATGSIVNGMKEVEKSAEIADSAESALNDIMSASKENERKMQVIQQVVNNMSRFSEEVRASMETFVRINRENDLAIEAITRSTDEMNLEMSEINKMAHLLFDMSQSQEDLISQFVLEEGR
jgi:methyl-accepting chemotaxis protein